MVDPFEGRILPHPRLVTGKRGVGKPINNTGWMYPYQYSVHSQSHWAGPWCELAGMKFLVPMPLNACGMPYSYTAKAVG